MLANQFVPLDLKVLDLNTLQNKMLIIRSDFVTWAARRQMFQTIAVFSSVNVIVSTVIEGLAELKVTDQRVYLHLSQRLVNAYDAQPEVTFFVIMHQLRYLTHGANQNRWKHLVNFMPLVKALEQVVPKALMLRAGIVSIQDDFALKEEIFGLAADGAIYEELSEFFGASCLTEVSKVMLSAPVTIEMLERMTGQSLERKQDWLYYAKCLVASLALRVTREPDLARLLVDRQIIRKVRATGLEGEAINPDAFADVDLLLGRAQGETKKMAESFASQLSEGPGTEAADNEEMYLARTELSEAIKRVIEIIKRALSISQKAKTRSVRTYSKPHNFLAEAPGLRALYRSERHAQAVIVLDTSGSMWIPEVLDQMAGLVYQLRKRDLIQKAYCCDVQLHPLEMSQGGRVRFKGFGGTVWTRDHHTQILSDLDTAQKLTIYYCTDGEVHGLKDALKDERVNLVVVNLPEVISEERYRKAKL